MFETEIVEICCPRCASQTARTVADLASTAGHQFECPGCGARVELDTKALQLEVEKIDRQIARIRQMAAELFGYDGCAEGHAAHLRSADRAARRSNVTSRKPRR